MYFDDESKKVEEEKSIPCNFTTFKQNACDKFPVILPFLNIPTSLLVIDVLWFSLW